VHDPGTLVKGRGTLVRDPGTLVKGRVTLVQAVA
jgi:hypothetical protein